ncbi:unnamed protein product, partial [Tilletia laevis]
REQAIADSLASKGDTFSPVFFSDGSLVDEGVGAAAYDPWSGRSQSAFLGGSWSNTVFEAELEGIQLALMMALQDYAELWSITIIVDNQAAIRALAVAPRRSSASICSSPYTSWSNECIVCTQPASFNCSGAQDMKGLKGMKWWTVLPRRQPEQSGQEKTPSQPASPRSN